MNNIQAQSLLLDTLYFISIMWQDYLPLTSLIPSMTGYSGIAPLVGAGTQLYSNRFIEDLDNSGKFNNIARYGGAYPALWLGRELTGTQDNPDPLLDTLVMGGGVGATELILNNIAKSNPQWYSNLVDSVISPVNKVVVDTPLSSEESIKSPSVDTSSSTKTDTPSSSTTPQPTTTTPPSTKSDTSSRSTTSSSPSIATPIKPKTEEPLFTSDEAFDLFVEEHIPILQRYNPNPIPLQAVRVKTKYNPERKNYEIVFDKQGKKQYLMRQQKESPIQNFNTLLARKIEDDNPVLESIPKVEYENIWSKGTDDRTIIVPDFHSAIINDPSIIRMLPDQAIRGIQSNIKLMTDQQYPRFSTSNVSHGSLISESDFPIYMSDSAENLAQKEVIRKALSAYSKIPSGAIYREVPAFDAIGYTTPEVFIEEFNANPDLYTGKKISDAPQITVNENLQKILNSGAINQRDVPAYITNALSNNQLPSHFKDITSVEDMSPMQQSMFANWLNRTLEQPERTTTKVKVSSDVAEEIIEAAKQTIRKGV